ncbi:MAG: alpha-E domain-containing protein [Pseudomonadota bacterium]|nr:alpha-E domain-containing protein [Pseudomonadota bacterium]
MLSRVAERLYWASRYLERAENIARLANVYARMLLDLPRNLDLGWHTLVVIMGDEEPFEQRYRRWDERNVAKFLLLDRDNSGSLISSLRMARENVRTTRDVLPREAWEEVNEIYLAARGFVSGRPPSRSDRERLTDLVIGGCQRLSGMLSSTMSAGDAYRFMRLGRNLERADMTTRILDVGAATRMEADEAQRAALESLLWINVLRSLSAYQMYRQHVRNRVKAADVIRYMVLDTEFPRALAFCVGQIEASFKELPGGTTSLSCLSECHSLLTTERVPTERGDDLHRYLDHFQLALGTVHDRIADTWFRLDRPAA